MAKRGYVRSIYLSGEDAEKLLEAFMEVAKREGLSFNQAIKKAMEEYVKRHGGGNPAMPLDRWVEDREFVAFPTLGERPKEGLLEQMDEDMLDEYASLARQHLEAAKREIRRRMAEGKWRKPYYW